MRRLKETRRVSAVFRIHETADIRRIGFGSEPYYETRAFYRNLRKHKLKGAKTEKRYMQAVHWRAKNKGFPEGFDGYRTYNRKREERFDASKRHHAYIPEIDIPERPIRRMRVRESKNEPVDIMILTYHRLQYLKELLWLLEERTEYPQKYRV